MCDAVAGAHHVHDLAAGDEAGGRPKEEDALHRRQEGPSGREVHAGCVRGAAARGVGRGGRVRQADLLTLWLSPGGTGVEGLFGSVGGRGVREVGVLSGGVLLGVAHEEDFVYVGVDKEHDFVFGRVRGAE